MVTVPGNEARDVTGRVRCGPGLQSGDAANAGASLVCAPITRTVRSIPTELPLGTDDGPPVGCVEVAVTFGGM